MFPALITVIAHFGMLDGSAGVATDTDHFICASDETNVLLVCSTAEGQPLGEALDLNQETEWFKPLIGNKHPKEADIEACTQPEGSDIVYWISSHARDKGKNGKPPEEKPERRRFFATRLSGGPAPTLKPEGKVCTTLLDDLVAAAELKDLKLSDAAQLAPNEEGGLNIESLCAEYEGNRLFIGLRSPIPHGKAVLIPLTNAEELLGGKVEHATFDQPIYLNLKGLGLRDMIWWPEKKVYLMIGGHYGEHLNDKKAPKPVLFTWTGNAGDDPVPLLDLDVSSLNPEGLVHFPDGRVLILSDDGAMKVDGEEQKDLLKDKKKKISELSFRSVWLTP